MHAACSLVQIDPKNTNGINALENLIANSQHEYTCLEAARSLVQIDPKHTKAINALENLIANYSSIGSLEGWQQFFNYISK